MKKRSTYSVILVLLFLGLAAFFMWYQSRSDRILDGYMKIYRFNRSEITFRSLERPLFGDGVILYQVEFPYLSIPVRVEKMVMREEENKLVLNMRGVVVPVLESLRILDAYQIVSIMKAYRPYQDILKRPLESIALTGRDYLKFNLDLTIDLSERPIKVSGSLSGKKLLDAQFVAFLQPDDRFYRNRLFYFMYGDLVQAFVSVRDNGVLSDYMEYAKQTGVRSPTEWEQIVHTNGELKRTLTDISAKPISLKGLYQNIPMDNILLDF